MPEAVTTAAAMHQRAAPACEDVQIVMSFDVEEHDRIEAAASLNVPEHLKAHYRARVGDSTRWLLEQLDRDAIKATFFVVGTVAEHNPGLVREIQRAGHEVACHSYAHRRAHVHTPASFEEDLRRSVGVLEDATGEAVRGYRAPTFSVVRETAWVLDVLAEFGLEYDSSIYPVRHDRYGVPSAPRGPFLARGREHAILELPPATLRLRGVNLPMGGGGYFRLFPLRLIEMAISQSARACSPHVAMVYFHPWEFDPGQPRLALRPLTRYRTYVGIHRTRGRLATLATRHSYARAIDLVRALGPRSDALPRFNLAAAPVAQGTTRRSGRTPIPPHPGSTEYLGQDPRSTDMEPVTVPRSNHR
jgi:polysaccharide deacetylase family protein (PEP-CTERM system associated)